VYDIATKKSLKSTDGKKNSIINGITDWVYEEEFAFVRAFDWSADSKKIAFIRFDETEFQSFQCLFSTKNCIPKLKLSSILKQARRTHWFHCTYMTLQRLR
jgi:dipeptidyl-peptidase-4